MKIRCNIKLFTSLNVIIGKTSSYTSKGILRNYHYWSDPKLGPGFIPNRSIPFSCHACTTILSIHWDSKIKEVINQPRYGRVYSCRYSQIVGYHNNWILMNFLDDGIDEEYYKKSNLIILDGNMMNISLNIMKVKYGAIDTDDSLCNGYYIIKFSSSPNTLQADLSIDEQLILSGKIACEGTYFFPISIDSRDYVLQKNKSINTIFPLKDKNQC